jgi:outer membrane protein OmpA-like peptidoglycan-associated protein
MSRQAQRFRKIFLVLGIAVGLSSAAYAQEPKAGKLKVYVSSPKEAYSFVDDKAIGPGTRSVRLGEGKHTLTVENYGFTPLRQDVSITPGKTTVIKAKLDPDGSKVSGPWGRIQLEVGTLTRGDYAVLLNGKTAGYFVGHVDEFNHNIWWKQELIVPVRTHEVTVTRNGQVVWTGAVPVAADQRVIINIQRGTQKDTPWPRGSKLGQMPRFKAGLVSASVAIAPVSGSINATPPRIDCNQPSQIKWASVETVDSDITNMSPVPQSGQKQVSPRKTTTYELTAAGPGGVVKTGTTVDVNPVIVSKLDTSTTEARYRRIGDKVLTQESTTLNWTASNVDRTALDPFGQVDRTGTRTVQLIPTQTTDGPVDETFTYTLVTSNVCGGSETKKASVHLVGSIEPIPVVKLNSVFFPTDYPEKSDANVGLLRSQKDDLTALAAGFTKYLEYDPDAKLSVIAYSDDRGPKSYNQSLSDRRAQSVKDFLVANGVSMDKIEVTAHGEDQPLDKSTVEQLQANNPNPVPEDHTKHFQASWLAYNRRVDVILLPTNAESQKYYPNNAPDLNILWQRPKPDRAEIEKAQ